MLADVAAVRLGIRDLPLSLDATGFSDPTQSRNDIKDSVHVNALLADHVSKVLGRLDDRQLVTLGAPEASSVELGRHARRQPINGEQDQEPSDRRS